MPTIVSLSDGTNIHLDEKGLTSYGLTEDEAIDHHFNPNKPNYIFGNLILSGLSGFGMALFGMPLMFYGVKYIRKIPK